MTHDEATEKASSIVLQYVEDISPRAYPSLKVAIAAALLEAAKAPAGCVIDEAGVVELRERLRVAEDACADALHLLSGTGEHPGRAFESQTLAKLRAAQAAKEAGKS